MTTEEEDQTSPTQEWQTVQRPKRMASSSLGARPSGDRAPSGTSPGGRAPGDKVQPVTAQTAQYRQEFPEDRQERETQGQLDCQECSFQTNEERRLNKHIEDIHRITCFTCRDKFESFSKMIDHRRVKHPSSKKCKWFPNCERGDTCLYRHEAAAESIENGTPQTTQAHGDTPITCRICNTDFGDKNKMMMHRKADHLDKVNMCKKHSTWYKL